MIEMSIEIQGEEEGWQDDECSTILAQDRTGTKLCNACVKIFHPGRKRKHYVEDKPVFYRHLEYLDTLRRSASHGCELCNHVLRSLRACETEYAPAQELRIRYILTDHDASPDSCIPEILNINFTYRCHSKSADPMLHSIEAFLIGKSSFRSLLYCSRFRLRVLSPR